jgi:hypothetical protein
MSMTQAHLAFSASAVKQKILPLRNRAEVCNTWLKQRLEDILPPLMQREKLDMWIVTSREYNEDPVIMSLLPEPDMSARRRTILVFTLQPDGSLERLSLSRYGFGDYYAAAWDPDRESQFDCLARMVRERNPATIGLNYSDTFAFGDGLTYNDYLRITGALDEAFRTRICSAERVALGWLEQRTQAELTAYSGIVAIGSAIIAEAYSNRVIHPGITTTQDVVWWMRQKMLDLGVEAWFQPTIDLQGPGYPFPPLGKTPEKQRDVILPGDMLHCDVGFYYLGLATDQQQLAYVLKPGETDAPEGLKAGLAEGNRLQDIHMSAMQVGKTGNQVLHDALEQARIEGLDAMIYTHPLGYHGHAAGPVIGLWDHQEGVPHKGDYEVFDSTCYSIELNVKKPVPEWDDQLVMFALEEDAAMNNGRMHWLSGRREAFHLIG